jgi:hypothetical protein
VHLPAHTCCHYLHALAHAGYLQVVIATHVNVALGTCMSLACVLTLCLFICLFLYLHFDMQVTMKNCKVSGFRGVLQVGIQPGCQGHMKGCTVDVGIKGSYGEEDSKDISVVRVGMFSCST